jgi:two-component system cell cycle sensor histidine kinase/response regulator CckA
MRRRMGRVSLLRVVLSTGLCSRTCVEGGARRCVDKARSADQLENGAPLVGSALGSVLSPDLLALTVEHCPTAVAVLDRSARYLMASERWLAELGMAAEALLGREHFEIWPQTSKEWAAAFRRCLSGNVEQLEDTPFQRADGSADWNRCTLRPWHSASGEVAGVLVVAQKTGEQFRIHAQLQSSEESLRLAVTGARVGTWHWNLRTGELIWSDLCYAILGQPIGSELSYERFVSMVHPDDRERVQAAVRHCLETRTEYDVEFRTLWPDDSLHWTSAKGLVFCDALGQPLRMVGIVLDISDQKAAERALLESEERYRMLTEGMPHLLWQLNATGTLVYANHGWQQYFGRSGIELFQWGEVVHPDDLPRVLDAWPEMSRGETNIDPFRMRRHDGVYRWFTCRSVPVRDAAGELICIIGISTDVDDLARTQEALRMSQARLDTALRAAGMGTWVWEVDSDRMFWDQALAQLLGAEPATAQTVTTEQLLARAHPEDRPGIQAALQGVARSERELDIEYRVQGSDGRAVWLATKGRLSAESDGQRRRMFGACVDVTHHKQLEEGLRQAQKMEAIGQLAGGVAHDFNNLLTVILGQIAIAEETDDLPLPAQQAIREINHAAERAASLTAQLLAFGRRQPMNSRNLPLDDLVLRVASMLMRLLGEQITLVVEPASTPNLVHADPNMLTQVLLNLGINARDAMPGGGSLVIQTRMERAPEVSTRATAATPKSDYVCLTVRDSGQGIAPADLPHIFEPFFTTKQTGKGTGLGLATVYGIVKQHQGWITVDSELGKGSTFRVYLPAVQGHAPEQPAVINTPRRGRGELVLLVEDEVGVRNVMQTVLQAHGYRLLVAADGNEALRCWAERAADIDLLVSDVVMPHGFGGCELAKKLQTERPELKVILCSGYSAANITQAMKAIDHSMFLPKPYRPDQLLELVRRLLDSD